MIRFTPSPPQANVPTNALVPAPLSAATVACAVALVMCASCGSRTGLLVDDTIDTSSADASLDATMDAEPDADMDADAAMVACTPGRFGLTKAIPSVMFVLDRSGSMDEQFSADGRSRWEVLTSALSTSLPPVNSSMAIGALMFPESGRGLDETCQVAGTPDIEPATGTVNNLIDLMSRTIPDGATPTADAIDTGAAALRSVRAASSARAIVLATDGGPNCNATLNTQTCECSDPTIGCHQEAIQCLDDTRTISRIAANAADGLPTYVIGIQDADEVQDIDVLNRMAIAGGRPRTGSAYSYFAAYSENDLTAAIEAIRDQVGSCTYLTTSVPNTDGSLTLTLNGAVIPYDATQMNGWFWADKSNGEIALAGAACTQAAGLSNPDLIVSVSCDMDAGQDASRANDAASDGASDSSAPPDSGSFDADLPD